MKVEWTTDRCLRLWVCPHVAMVGWRVVSEGECWCPEFTEDVKVYCGECHKEFVFVLGIN
jgi:hypothetical protein